MDHFPLNDAAARQYVDACTVFEALHQARSGAAKVQGGMYWKRRGKAEYLVRTTTTNAQRYLGPRAAETESQYASFTSRKTRAEERLRSLREALLESERMNKALRVGRVPTLVISVLQALEAAGLLAHFTVVGTHALYAYEAAAGVRLAQGVLATHDVDLLWDARKRVRFVTDMKRLESSVLDVLRRADRTFERKPGQAETAINDKGFEVDFLRRQVEDGDPHPIRFTDDEDDLWPVQAVPASVLAQARRFEQIVVSSTGRMALMPTVDPLVFVEFKRWMSKLPARDVIKRSRDASQARVVNALITERLLMPR